MHYTVKNVYLGFGRFLLQKKIKNTVFTAFMILCGNALLAFLVAAFIIPHDIIMGGTTGIGIVLSNIFQVDTAIFVLVLNVALLLVGLFILGKRFFIATAASSVLYPVFLGLMERIPGIGNLTDDPLLASLFGGVLMGIALGMVIRVGSSTGGMDIVNLILHKYFHLPVSVFVYITDIIVVGGQAIFNEPEKTLLGIVVLVLETIILEQVMIFGKSQIQIYIVSEKYEEIRESLLTELGAGVTMHYIETGHLGKMQKAVLCVIPPQKLYAANERIHQIDENAFLTITKIKEVRGKGFTKEQEWVPKD